jgi:hypothetical protein
MKTTYQSFTALQIAEMCTSGVMIADPVGQRPPVTVNSKKSLGIVSSLLNGSGIGMITVRDIRDDKLAQKIYPGAHYLVVDGGHRCRAIQLYYTNKLIYSGKNYRQSDFNLDDYQVMFDVRACSAKEACELFRKINDCTPVNRMESLMSNEESEVAKIIRMLTISVREYGYNSVHPLFERDIKKDGTESSKHWAMEPNHRRKWDEWIAMSLVYLHKKHDDKIGWEDIHSLIEDDWTISKEKMKVLNRFLDDALEFRINRQKTFNGDVWDSFFSIWFGFYNYKSKEFVIKEKAAFAKEFVRVYSKLTGTADTSLDGVTIKVHKETHMVKEWFRKEVKNHFSDPFTRKLVFDTFMNYFNNDGEKVLYREEKRSMTEEEREQHLAKQGYVCAIDGLPLTLKDSVCGHDTPWSKGGQLKDSAIVRYTHNDDMGGGVTLDEYRMILSARGKKRKAA